jgi:hypothetical protein
MAASRTGAAVIVVCGDNPAGLLLACLMSQRHCVRAWVGDGLASRLESLLGRKTPSAGSSSPQVGYLEFNGKLFSVNVLVGDDAETHGTERTPSLSIRRMSTAKDKDTKRKQGAGRNTVSCHCHVLIAYVGINVCISCIYVSMYAYRTM